VIRNFLKTVSYKTFSIVRFVLLAYIIDMSTKIRAKEYLDFSPFLSVCGLEDKDLELLMFTKQDSIWDERQPKDYVVLICKGMVEVYSTNCEGREILINTLGPGQCFGIADLYSEIPICTFLKNKRDCTLLFIKKEKIKSSINENKQAEIEYKILCNNKIRFLIGRIMLLSSYSARTKILDFLSSQSLDQIKMSKAKLARLLAISKATLFRELSALETERIISYEGQLLLILNRKKIEGLLNEAN